MDTIRPGSSPGLGTKIKINFLSDDGDLEIESKSPFLIWDAFGTFFKIIE